MKSFRDEFYLFFESLFERLSELDISIPVSLSTGLAAVAMPERVKFSDTIVGRFFKSIVTWAKKPENRTNALLLLWVVLVFVLFILTAILVFGLFQLTSSYKPGISIATFFWAFSLGICVLFLLPPKLITTIFGGLAGIGISELGADTGLIAKANKALTQIANQIGVIVSGSGKTTDPFITWMVWLFFAVLLITCLPAFFRDKH